MKKQAIYPVLISMSVSIFSFAAVNAETVKLTPLEKNMDLAQRSFDQGSYVKAERTWKKVQLELAKGAPDEKLANVWQRLGETYTKENKFSDAESAYKQSIEVSKSISKDPQEAIAKLQDLSNIYRPIDLQSFDETATSFAKHVGAVSASALNKDEKHHIEISLDKRFQQKIEELVSSFMPKKADGTAQEMPEIPSSAGAPPVKQLRLDKKIAFDLRRSDDGIFTLANIEGIFFDVGLWAKLKGLVMLPTTTQDKPSVELTAGAFGVEKKVKTDLPKTVFDRLKEGIDKFDPFAGKQITATSGTAGSAPAASVTAPPASDSTPSSVPTGGGDGAGRIDANAPAGGIDVHAPAGGIDVHAPAVNGLNGATTLPSSSVPQATAMPDTTIPVESKN